MDNQGGIIPPLNHQITSLFPLFSLFHQQKMAPITITSNLFISPITKQKCPNHQKKILQILALKMKDLSPPLFYHFNYIPLYHIYINTRHLKAYKYSPFNSLLIWLYPPVFSSHIMDELTFYKSNCLVDGGNSYIMCRQAKKGGGYNKKVNKSLATLL